MYYDRIRDNNNSRINNSRGIATWRKGEEMNPISEVYNMDCLEYMKSLPDNYFDLCIADPPYGIGFSTYNRTNKTSTGVRYRANKYDSKSWDLSIPSDALFEEIKRVTKKQIIWGGNYFPVLWKQRCKSFIFWDKKQPVDNFSAGELAWTSFDKPAKCFRYAYYGNINSEKIRIHPTQKPIALYAWILDNYAKEGDKIFDPFLGSGSSRIACYKKGFDFYACELDKDYYEAQEERFRRECFGEVRMDNEFIVTQNSLF